MAEVRDEARCVRARRDGAEAPPGRRTPEAFFATAPTVRIARNPCRLPACEQYLTGYQHQLQIRFGILTKPRILSIISHGFYSIPRYFGCFTLPGCRG